jgi:sugar O-acyltransferase (sialic acid O-acetyltransferase NeuD family)
MSNLFIYGAGGFAREVAWLAQTCSFDVAGFIDDNANHHGAIINGIRVLSLEDAYSMLPNAYVVGAIGSPKARESAMQRASAAGFETIAIVHPRVEISTFVDIGAGTVVCAGSIITTNIRLGRHVQINLDCTIGHDVIIDDFGTLAPGVHVSGVVHIGRGAYIGTGAVILNGTQEAPLEIGEYSVVGAGACVTKSVAQSITVVGVPARELPHRD